MTAANGRDQAARGSDPSKEIGHASPAGRWPSIVLFVAEILPIIVSKRNIPMTRFEFDLGIL
jgi:hypothetical protein